MSEFKKGKFVWFEIVTTKVEAVSAFYSETIGWKVGAMDMPGGGSYTMFQAGERGVAGVQPMAGEGAPPHWVGYASTDDIAATAATILELGGKILKEVTDTPMGKMAVAADPQGAVFCLWQSADGDKEDQPGVHGAFHWHELYAADIAGVVPFYAQVFGYELAEMPMPTGSYTIFNKDGAPRAGGMTSPMQGVPPMWLPYIQVDDADAAIARATAHGGEVVVPLMDTPGVGRHGMVKDPIGAVIGLITPASRD